MDIVYVLGWIGLVLAGHAAIWTAIFNRSHGFDIPAGVSRSLELIEFLAAFAILLDLGYWLWQTAPSDADPRVWLTQLGWRGYYVLFCLLFFAVVVAKWIYRLRWLRSPRQLLSNHSRMIHIAKELGFKPVAGKTARILTSLPRNQILDLCVNEKQLLIPRLPAELDGLTITHFSDLHFTGKITRPYFDRVFAEAAALDSEYIAITGDILECLDCYEWLPSTFGKLSARGGMLFILGNHDKRVRDPGRLRTALQDLGLADLGNRHHVTRSRGHELLWSGNEQPWFGPAVAPPPPRDESLRILLSHSPDQFSWAGPHGFDLMLAGHTHGGQIQFPVIGPVVCPSRYGVRYADGTFYRSPTLMHVSRGISGLDPMRFRCPPELTKLVLRAPRPTMAG